MIPMKASLFIMSHLSDAQETSNPLNASHHINFAKFLLLKYPNTDSVVEDIDEDYKEFVAKRSSKAHIQKNNIEVKHSQG